MRGWSRALGRGWVRTALRTGLGMTVATACGLLGSQGLGLLSIALTVAVWLAVIRGGGIVTHLVELLVIWILIGCVLGWLGPVVGGAMRPGVVGAILALPGAAAISLPGRRSIASRPFAVSLDDVAVSAMTAVGGWLFWRPLEGSSPLRWLGEMLLGGTDYLSHFDYLQNVWFHHGFLFVSVSTHVLESRPHMSATPMGVEMCLTAVGIVLTGHETLPSAVRLLAYFRDGYVGVGACTVLMMTAATARLTRRAGLPAAMRTLAVLFVGAASAVGPIASLYVYGFNSFLLGLGLMVVSVVWAVTSTPESWRLDILIVGCAAVGASYVYTLTAPADLMALGILVWRTAPGWRTARAGSLKMALPVVAITTGIVSGVVPTLGSAGALQDPGGIAPLNTGLLIGCGVGCAVTAVVARQRLPQPVLWMAVGASLVGAMVVLFNVGEMMRLGTAPYYAVKVRYLWFALALLALTSEVAALARPLLHEAGRSAALSWTAGVLAAIAAVLSFGYVGPAMTVVAPDAAGRPAIVNFGQEQAWNADELRVQDTLAATILRARHLPGRPIVLLWGPGVSSRQTRWAAVLRRTWLPTQDQLALAVGDDDSGAPQRLLRWVAAHRDPQVLILATDPHWDHIAALVKRETDDSNLTVTFAA